MQQDLVGVGVTDTGKDVLIRERALQRVISVLEAFREHIDPGVDDLEAARVELREVALALNQT